MSICDVLDRARSEPCFKNFFFEINSLQTGILCCHMNHLTIYCLRPRQSFHICLIKLDLLRAFDPTTSHNLNSCPGPPFWNSLSKHLTTVCIMPSLDDFKFFLKSVKCEHLLKYSSSLHTLPFCQSYVIKLHYSFFFSCMLVYTL